MSAADEKPAAPQGAADGNIADIFRLSCPNKLNYYKIGMSYMSMLFIASLQCTVTDTFYSYPR